jgi:ubiquinone/menaquinone biosynthesis C-methylase UbiE
LSLNLIEKLYEDVRHRHPRSIYGIQESLDLNREAFNRICGTYLEWCVAARGEVGLASAVDAFARFCSDVNLAQGRYELAGSYENKSFEECRRAVYDDPDTMTDYLWGVYLSNFLWVHHLDLMLFFEQRFLTRLKVNDRLVEIASGHGGWGLWALHQINHTSLTGFDVSATSIAISGSLAQAAGMAQRAHYMQANAMDLVNMPSPQANACICCFLVEHLESPEGLLRSMAHVLQPNGLAFFTGALTAAQVDHIYEFKSESELVLLAERAGFRVLDTRSVAPARQLQKARYLPRSMALILQKKSHEHC